jgi:predicted DNA-binding transcriptional regulator YafY
MTSHLRRSRRRDVKAIVASWFVFRRVGQLVRSSPAHRTCEPLTIDQAALRSAIREQRKIPFCYRDLQGRVSERVVQALITAVYRPMWLLAAWCEYHEGVRIFRLDRMLAVMILDVRFRAEPGMSAFDFLKQHVERPKMLGAAR